MDESGADESTSSIDTCGDGETDPGEECDLGSGNSDNGYCTADCHNAECGDALVLLGVEACDDGNIANDDECTALCQPPACDDGLESGVETDVDCGGNCPSCEVGAACIASQDCQTSFCEQDVCAVAPSCQAIKAGDQQTLDGVYTVDPDGEGGEPEFDVYCDMTTDGGGWMMVFKATSGVDGNANTLWNGGPLNDEDSVLLDTEPEGMHYVNRFIGQSWNQNGGVVVEVRAQVYDDDAPVKFMKFYGAGTTNVSWFASLRLSDSSYLDLMAGPWNFFSIVGDPSFGRTWFVNRNYGGCFGDVGWLVLDNLPDPCAWESDPGMGLRVIYSTTENVANYASADVGVADVFAVFVR